VTASNNKSDRPQVKIWDTWKTLKYLNINDSFHLKDLEISKYKQESNILIIAYSSVVTVAEWLDGSLESQNRPKSPAVVRDTKAQK
jgi:hypothetical protein